MKIERDSIVTDFKKECGNYINVSFTMIFIFAGIVDFIGEYLTDIFGRKLVYQAVIIFQIIAYLLGITIQNYWINVLANAMIVTGVAMNYSLLIVFINESLPD